MLKFQRALISVSDKTGIVEFAQALVRLDIEIISTGGTSELLQTANIPHRTVEEFTGAKPIFDGRVKTLHSKIHGAILGKRDVHAQEALELDVPWIDLVVVNFYPFATNQTVEYIDIGGPTMIRAAAKNFAWVCPIIAPADYALIIDELAATNTISLDTRKACAAKVFACTSEYDALIAKSLQADHSAIVTKEWREIKKLRYGENPHQQASAYRALTDKTATGVLQAEQHQGKELSYNNLLDADAARNVVLDFNKPACAVIKHGMPCGVSAHADLLQAITHALAADAQSAFGGVVALNRPCGKLEALQLTQTFLEVICAPSFSAEALLIFASKPNLRILTVHMEHDYTATNLDWRMLSGGALVQERDRKILLAEDLTVVTKKKVPDSEINNILFAWRVLKNLKSNAILLAKNETTVGIGAGQVSRVDAVWLAVHKAGVNIAGCILASDGFFPFRDSIDYLAGRGVEIIVQPGGSVRDEEVIAACDEHNIAMICTGTRCFRH